MSYGTTPTEGGEGKGMGGSGGFVHPLLDQACLDPIVYFLQSCLCPCCTAGQIEQTLGGEIMTATAISCCCFPCFRTLQRGKIRARVGVAGSEVEDCLTVWCCYCCALMQEAKTMGLGAETYDQTFAREGAPSQALP